MARSANENGAKAGGPKRRSSRSVSIGPARLARTWEENPSTPIRDGQDRRQAPDRAVAAHLELAHDRRCPCAVAPDAVARRAPEIGTRPRDLGPWSPHVDHRHRQEQSRPQEHRDEGAAIRHALPPGASCGRVPIRLFEHHRSRTDRKRSTLRRRKIQAGSIAALPHRTPVHAEFGGKRRLRCHSIEVDAYPRNTVY